MKKRKLKQKIRRKLNRTVREVQIEGLSRRELLGLTRALINLREGRQLEFSVPYASQQVIECAEQVAKMPSTKREQEIARINAIALKCNI